RDAKKKLVTTQTKAPQSAAAKTKQNTPAGPGRTAPTAKPATPSAAAGPAKPPSPADAAGIHGGPSKLTRAGKPPSQRFHSRVRTDISRNQSRTGRAAAGTPATKEPATGESHIYRRNWGARG
ncbi:MAG: hypothetical protein GWO24_12495, partial [Akkermansiaceae bacterium]|nr:hypothetical protein [Akkermansiaceae bacterium]